MRKAIRHCNDFCLCVNVGKKGEVMVESPAERQTLYQYNLYGGGRAGEIFKEDYIESEVGVLLDVRKYVNDYIIFQATEDFFTIGFNTLDKGQNWEGRLVSKDETKLNLDINRELRKETFLICFDGKPVVNEKQMKRYDYAKIDLNKDYNVELNGGALGLFYKN
tara:strand:+ start:1881 stop:2372 length:492 start_codon:yes stop_codon:yes gene_type:complete